MQFARYVTPIYVLLRDFVNKIVRFAIHQEINRVVRHFDQLVEILSV